MTVTHMRPRRLQPQQRREHLLDTAAVMFAEQPYDDVMIQDIAARAGVSRALMYHYFSTKRDVYAALFMRASDRFLARVSRDPRLPLAQQLATALEGHIESFVDHPFEAITINRGALSDDPTIRAIVAEQLNVVGQRLVDQLVAEGHARDAIEIALVGEFMVGAAGQGEVVDVGDGVGGVGVAVVGLAEVGGHGAARERAAAVFGVQHNSLSR